MNKAVRSLPGATKTYTILVSIAGPFSPLNTFSGIMALQERNEVNNYEHTIRQGLERFMVHGYTAVPVLNDQEQYIGSVTEGDFLRHLLACQTTDLKVQEGYRLGSIVRRDFCPALQIDADSEQVVTAMLNQNFVPIVDGRNALCGILTRKRLIEFLAQARDKKE